MALATVLLLTGGVAVFFFLYKAYLPKRRNLLWRDAVVAYKTQRYDVAVIKLREFMKMEPSHEEGYRMLAKIGELRSDYFEAALNWQKVRELNGDDQEARERLAECLLNIQQYSLIMELYEPGYRVNHLNVHELLAFAEASVMTGDKVQNEMIVEHVREKVNDTARISFLEGLMAIKAKDYEGGKLVWEKLSRQKGLSQMFHWRLEVFLGSIMNAHGEIEGAETHYLQANAIAPRLTNMLLGDFYRVNRMYEKSIDNWKIELMNNPENDYPRMQLVEIYGGLGKVAGVGGVQQSLDPLTRSRRRLSNYADAALHFWRNEYEITLDTLRKCFNYYDRDFYHVMRLCCELELDLNEHLAEDMDFLRQKPLDVNFVRLAIEFLYRSLQKNLKNNDLNTAIDYAKLMWSFTRMELPEMYVAAKLLMANKYEARCFHESLELGLFCMKYDSKDKEVIRIVMMSSLGTGNFSDCVAYSMTFGDGDVEALVARGNAFAFSDRREESAKAFEKALVLDPGNAMLKEYAWRMFRLFGMEERMSKVESMYNEGNRMDMIRQSCLKALHLLWKQDNQGFSSASMKILKEMILDGKEGDVEIRYWRGVIFSWNDMIDDGILELKNVLRLGRTNGFVLCELSEVYARKGRLVEALDIARGTAELWPGWYVYNRCLRRREQEVRNLKLGLGEKWRLKENMKMEAKQNTDEKPEADQGMEEQIETEQGPEGQIETEQGNTLYNEGNE